MTNYCDATTREFSGLDRQLESLIRGHNVVVEEPKRIQLDYKEGLVVTTSRNVYRISLTHDFLKCELDDPELDEIRELAGILGELRCIPLKPETTYVGPEDPLDGGRAHVETHLPDEIEHHSTPIALSTYLGNSPGVDKYLEVFNRALLITELSPSHIKPTGKHIEFQIDAEAYGVLELTEVGRFEHILPIRRCSVPDQFTDGFMDLTFNGQWFQLKANVWAVDSLQVKKLFLIFKDSNG